MTQSKTPKDEKKANASDCEQQTPQTQANEEDDCCQTNSQNQANANRANQPKFSNELFGHPREIPPKIRQYFEKVPNSTPFENVNYTRVVRIDLCPRPYGCKKCDCCKECDCCKKPDCCKKSDRCKKSDPCKKYDCCNKPDPGFDITVHRVDIDFADLKKLPHINGKERFTDEFIYELAYLFFMALKKKGVSLCENFSARKVLDGVFEQLSNPISEQNQRDIGNVVLGDYSADDIIALLESENIDPLAASLYASPFILNEALLAEFNAFDAKSITARAERALDTFDDVYRPVPSSFDINFKGPTAVIFKSEIRHLRFMPEPFIYTNPRDRIYYRNEEIDNDFEWCAFVNAYDKGVVEDNLPSRTPCNQEHKIDLSMVLCVFVEEHDHPRTGEVVKEHWKFTPIKIDPPHDNGGKG